MARTFQSLGELGSYLEAAGVRVVDPGYPLTDLADDGCAYDVWRSQPSVRKVVDFVARNVASVPLHVYERVSDLDRQRVIDHPLARLLAAPAPRMVPFRLWHALLADWLIYDRWCAAKKITDTGVLQLVRVPARRFRFVDDGLDQVAKIAIWTREGHYDEHDPDGFVYDHGYSQRGANGTSPMETLRDLLAEAREAVEYRRAVWANGARVPAVIERPADAPSWDDTARGRFVSSMRAFIRKGGREGGVPVLEDGMTMKVVNAFSPRDTGDLEGRRLTDAEVASAYHIAPELVGARAGTYSNIEAYRQMLYRDALGPLIVAVEQVLNAMLTPDLAGGRALYVEANIEAKLRGSFEEQARVLSSAVGAPWMLRSEARARANLPAIEHADELVVPLNVTVGGLASPRDTAPPPKAGRLAKAARPDDLGTFAAERDAFERALTHHLEGLAAELTRRLELKAADDLAEVWGTERAEREAALAELVLAWGYRLAQVGAWEVLTSWNPEADGWSAEVMLAWLAKAAATYAAEIEQATYDRVAEAADQGDQAIRDALAGWAEVAALHALTASTEFRGFGGHDAAKASGLARKTWHARGRSSRPTHAALSGTSVEIWDVFGNGARWPGDRRAGAKETARCRCHLTYSRSE
ncbi:phage portal protein [Microtetraspora niveoalba]|uniref:phage portal protein n=1 Tax=Microtetraspora niveoalba TaxID=46175 RepID=UPI000830D479|nr:phage portal protein [Microtetraspora niveoalba]